MIKYIFLGLIQGLTEFLPVSSSAHLVIFQRLFGVENQEIVLSVILHLGTISATVIFFFKDILKILRMPKTIFFILLATAITGIIGVLGKDFFESIFNSVKLVSLALLVTGIILFATRLFSGNRKELNIKDIVIFGFVQAVAIIPGISRSGSTISTLIFRKLDKDTALKFSFIASIPAVLGAALLEAKEINFALQTFQGGFIIGFVASLISGLFSLWLLRRIINKLRFYYFGYYCIIAAIAVLLFIK